jgi:hypothetical protein
MASQTVFRWLDGLGWLVLAGGVDVSSDVRALTLERAVADGGVAYVSLQPDADDGALADMEDLGAPSGYLVDVLAEDDATVYDRLASASIVVIEDSANAETLRNALLGAAINGIQEAYERGAVVLAEGAAAAVFGAWLMPDSGEKTDGFGWLSNTGIIPASTDMTNLPQSRALMDDQADAIIVGLGVGSALVLGPNGEVETWGRREVTVALGPAYSP